MGFGYSQKTIHSRLGITRTRGPQGLYGEDGEAMSIKVRLRAVWALVGEIPCLQGPHVFVTLSQGVQGDWGVFTPTP